MDTFKESANEVEVLYGLLCQDGLMELGKLKAWVEPIFREVAKVMIPEVHE
jgi:hypothetical protein